jgi:DNA mismatch repair ATPase MutS
MAIAGRRSALRVKLSKMIEAVGELEGLSCLAAYAFEHSAYPFPVFIDTADENSLVFRSSGLGHPLISSQTCVQNPVEIHKDLRFLLITGSNMSGKSTYLRTIGLNYVMARAAAPICGESLTLSIFALATSIEVTDSLQDGRSHFAAEVSRIREIIDLADSGPLLFLLDELLSGTNSEDRRGGVAGVVEHLLELGASGLLTTHDLALTELVAKLSTRAKNVHFVDHLGPSGMTFDYRLRDGIVPHSNGAAILAEIGIIQTRR